MDRAGRASIAVLLNRGSGGAGGDENAAERIGGALRGAGIEADIRPLDGGGISEQARRAVAEGAEIVIVAGGDGSVSAAAGALAGSDTALGILPLGTLNHFARDLHIPNDLAGAAALIAHGQSRRVDVAELNGRVFVNNSAIGLYPLMVLDREAQQRRLGRSKRLAMLVAAIRTLARFDKARLALTLEADEAKLETPLLFVGNNAYQLAIPAAGRRERLDSGKLNVILLRRRTRSGFLLAALRALASRARSDDLLALRPLEALTVDSARARLPLSLDGEALVLAPPLNYRIRPRALKVIAP